MTKEVLEYKIATASQQDIYQHLKECESDFIPPLTERVDIEEYSKKIFVNAILFEAHHGEKLIGLVAGYFSDLNNKGTAFITNVSVIKDFKGKGVASALLRMFIDFARDRKFTEILLEVSKYNNPAIDLYRKFEFYNSKIEKDLLIMRHEIKPLRI